VPTFVPIFTLLDFCSLYCPYFVDTWSIWTFAPCM
jgi:hypothetical protein